MDSIHERAKTEAFSHNSVQIAKARDGSLEGNVITYRSFSHVRLFQGIQSQFRYFFQS
jgi:hypothetical protein